MQPHLELVDIVDETGQVVGTATRGEMRARCLPHRCVYLLVFNGRGELFIHQRTATKDVYPSFWDTTIGGVLAAGESFDLGARREGREELGVDIEPEPLFPFHYNAVPPAVFAHVYRVRHDGPFHLQVEEIVAGLFVPLAEVERRARCDTFCPDGLAVLEAYRASGVASAPRESGLS